MGRGAEEEEEEAAAAAADVAATERRLNGGCRAPDSGLRRSPPPAPRPLARQGGRAPVATEPARPSFYFARASRLWRLLASPSLSPAPS